MRLLMLVPHPGVRGPLPKIVPLLADSLRSLGCAVETAPWSRHTEDESLPAKVGGRLQDLFRIAFRLAGGQFDVLFVSTAHTWPGLVRDVPLVLLTRPLCPHRVLQFHGSDSHLLNGPGHSSFKLLSKLLVRNCDATLVLSEEERRQWAAFEPTVRFEVVANPFVVTGERQASPDAKSLGCGAIAQDVCHTLLFVGRLMPEKGIFDVLEAMPRLLDHTECRLIVAGDGPAAADVKRRIRTLGLEGRVELRGYVAGTGLLEAYEEADVLVLPTYWAEGFPTVILEAMNAGLPIVTTPLRGAADRLIEGVNVMFVPPRRPDRLAEVLSVLLDDDSLRVEMGRHNRQRIVDFLPERVAPRYLEVLRSVVGEGVCNDASLGAGHQTPSAS